LTLHIYKYLLYSINVGVEDLASNEIIAGYWQVVLYTSNVQYLSDVKSLEILSTTGV